VTGSSDVPEDMTPALPPLDDTTVERLLRRAGVDAVDPADELAPVARFLAAVADLGDTRVVARGALAELLAGGFAPAHVPAQPPRTGRLRALRGPVARLAGLSLVAQLLTGTGVAVASVTAAAGAGVLPASLQEPVGQVLNVVTPFHWPTVPAGTAPGPASQDALAPAGTSPASPADGAAGNGASTLSTVEPAPTPPAASADASPSAAASASAQPSPNASPTPAATPTGPEAVSPSALPGAEPTSTPSGDPTTAPTPTTTPSADSSGRPTRQNEPPDGPPGEDGQPPADGATVVDDPALVAFD
jgi:hypothetical protein